MNSYIIPTWLLLVATTASIQKANCKRSDTPLINAVRRNNVDLIKRLLRNGADANATNNNGETALMFAARKGDDEMVEILLPKSDAKAVPNSGYTALMLAAKYGNVKMVERLLPKSDPKATNCTGGKKLPMILQKNTNAIKLLGFFNNTK
jgi:ankyrin repeat protein